MTKETFTTTIVLEGSMCAIELPFDPARIFGKVRAPVTVRLNGYSYRSTVARMGGKDWVPLRKSHREAAGVEGGQRLEVTLELDTAERVIEPAPDFVRALEAGGAWEAWKTLSFSRQREYHESVEGAVRPETRERRIRKAVAALTGATPKKRR